MKASELAALLMQHPHAEVYVQMGETNECACPIDGVSVAEYERKNILVLHENEGTHAFLPELELVELRG
jgi:hypothetical protein